MANVPAALKRRITDFLESGSDPLDPSFGVTDAKNLSVTDWEWVDVREAGLGDDDTGAFLENNAADNRLLVFPEGTYHFDTTGFVYGYENFGIYSPGGNAVFTPRDVSNDELVKLGANSDPANRMLFKGIRTDTQSVALLEVVGEAVVEDVTFLAEKTTTESTFHLNVRVPDPEDTAVFRNIKMLEGGAHQGLNDPSNEAGGIYVPGAHAGSVVFENCRVGGFPNNGLYASGPGADSGEDGRVIVRGGYYENSAIANIRIGGYGSKVEDATISINNTKSGFEDLRGIYCRQGGGHTFDNVRIEISVDGVTGIAHVGGGKTATYDGIVIEDNSTNSLIIDLSAEDSGTHAVTMRDWDVRGSSTYDGSYPLNIERDHTRIEDMNIRLPDNAAFYLSGDDMTIVRSEIDSGVKGMLDDGTNNKFEQNTISGGTTYGTRAIVNGTGREAAGSGNSPTAANWKQGQTVENTDDNTVWKKTSADTMVQIG